MTGLQLAEAVEEEVERVLSELCTRPRRRMAVYPLRFNDGFRPAVLEVCGGRQTVRPATSRELLDNF